MPKITEFGLFWTVVITKLGILTPAKMGGMMVKIKCVLRNYMRPLDWFVERV